MVDPDYRNQLFLEEFSLSFNDRRPFYSFSVLVCQVSFSLCNNEFTCSSTS